MSKKIRNAGIAGLVFGFLTLVAAVYGATSSGGTANVAGMDFGLWQLIDVFLIFSMTVGIFLNSRIAALSMLCYYIFNQVYRWLLVGLPDIIGILVVVGFIYLFFEGARATIAHHRPRVSPQELSTSPQ